MIIDHTQGIKEIKPKPIAPARPPIILRIKHIRATLAIYLLKGLCCGRESVNMAIIKAHELKRTATIIRHIEIS